MLQVINANPGDVAPVFDTILHKAHALCGAAIGSLMLYDGANFRAAATHGWPDSITAFGREPAPPNRGRQMLIDGERFVHVLDIRAFEPGPNSPWGDVVRKNTDARTALLVPLRRDGALLGFISAFRTEVRAFSDKEIVLLENFAAQAVIAMENARLLGELQARSRDLLESLEYQTATSDVLNVISRSTSDVQPVLDTVVETATRLCGADTGAITIREGEVYRRVSSSYSAAEPEFWAIQRQRTIVPGRETLHGRVALEGRVVHVADIRADPDFAFPESAASGRRTVLGVPLLREGAVLGTINLARKGSSHTPSDKSTWCAPLPTKRSSRSRTRGCSASCRLAHATSKNRSNTRPRPATCSTSSAARPPMCNRCWTR